MSTDKLVQDVREATAALAAQQELTSAQLTTLLADAMQRIAALEHERDELGKMCAWFSAEIAKANNSASLS